MEITEVLAKIEGKLLDSARVENGTVILVLGNPDDGIVTVKFMGTVTIRMAPEGTQFQGGIKVEMEGLDAT